MFVGTVDDLGDKTDSRWAKNEIMTGGKAIEKGFYNEYYLGHASFMVAKNFTYFDDVKKVLTQHNGNPSKVGSIELNFVSKALEFLI